MQGFGLVMPMHGFFEIKSAMHRIAHIDGRQIAPRYRTFNSAHLLTAKRLGLTLVTRYGPC